jgi:hypothetical protein
MEMLQVEKEPEETGEYACPLATHDISHNLKMRNHAFIMYGYGPPNPNEPNILYWLKKAAMYDVSVPEAMTMRCGNCAAFIQTSQMMDCISKGLEKAPEDEGGYDDIVIATADLGFCELFAFKCAASRTCDAWLVGGPITDKQYAKIETLDEDGEYDDAA